MALHAYSDRPCRGGRGEREASQRRGDQHRHAAGAGDQPEAGHHQDERGAGGKHPEGDVQHVACHHLLGAQRRRDGALVGAVRRRRASDLPGRLKERGLHRRGGQQARREEGGVGDPGHLGGRVLVNQVSQACTHADQEQQRVAYAHDDRGAPGAAVAHEPVREDVNHRVRLSVGQRAAGQLEEHVLQRGPPHQRGQRDQAHAVHGGQRAFAVVGIDQHPVRQ